MILWNSCFHFSGSSVSESFHGAFEEAKELGRTAVGEMNRAVRDLALAGLRQRHPNDSPAQRRRRLADLLLGQELAARVYGPVLEDG